MTAVVRDVWENSPFRPEPMSQREAWLWLVEQAGRDAMSPVPGQIIASTRRLAAEFGWTHPRIRRFLDLIEAKDLISRSTSTGISAITIRNFSEISRLRANADTHGRILRRDASNSPAAPSLAIRRTVWDIDSLGQWVAGAARGEACIYHIGTLASDRADSPDLNAMAEVVTILHEAGAVMPTAHRFRTAAIAGWTYIATRTEAPARPQGIIRGIVSPAEWRALIAIRDRDHDTSVTRAIRNAVSATLGNSDAIAGRILATLKEKGLVAPQEIKGWGLSDRGEEVLA